MKRTYHVKGDLLLMQEFLRIIEGMEISYYKPAVKSVRNRILNGKLK